MKRNEEMEKWIEDSMNSFDDAARAAPKPYLLTRMNERLNKTVVAGFWEKAGSLITRPSVAFPALALLILINVGVIVQTGGSGQENFMDQPVAGQTDDFSNTVATIYDIENP